MRGSSREDIAKGHKETFGDEGFAYYLGCGNGFMNVCICQIYQSVHIEYVQFIICC